MPGVPSFLGMAYSCCRLTLFLVICSMVSSMSWNEEPRVLASLGVAGIDKAMVDDLPSKPAWDEGGFLDTGAPKPRAIALLRNSAGATTDSGDALDSIVEGEYGETAQTLHDTPPWH